MLNAELLKILRCPACKGELDYSAKESTLRCRNCTRTYPIENDIPIMLTDDDRQSRP